MLLPTHNPPAGKEDPEKIAGKSILSPEYAASPVVAGVAYCCVSAAMVLLNKFALSGFDFSCPNTLLLLQCSTAVVFVKLAEILGFWKLERLRWDIVQVRRQPLFCFMRTCISVNISPFGLRSAGQRVHCSLEEDACDVLFPVVCAQRHARFAAADMAARQRLFCYDVGNRSVVAATARRWNGHNHEEHDELAHHQWRLPPVRTYVQLVRLVNSRTYHRISPSRC